VSLFSERRDRRIPLIAGLAIVSAVALLDFVTPANVDFSEFYMVAVMLVAWSVGFRAGFAFAFLCACAVLAVDATLREPSQANAAATALFNWLSDFAVLAALAFATDRVYQERRRWMRTDAERATLLRVLDRELPRPLRAIDWFSRTFDEALDRASIESLRTQFGALRHHVREVTFLATDLLAVGHLRSGDLPFELQRVSLNALVTEAADGTLHRARVFRSLSSAEPWVLADPDRLRHAVSSLVGRYLELSSYEPVTVLTRLSAREAVVEVGSGAGAPETGDTELVRMLVAGNGGRFVQVERGDRGSLASIYLPSAPATQIERTEHPASTEETTPR
jgi:signal transduction histidine kinase